MDTVSIVVTMVGASLAIALLFASTVLSYSWWKLIAIRRNPKKSNNIGRGQKQSDVNRKLVSNPLTTVNSAQIKTKSKSQTLVQLKRTSSLSELINKKVQTCEMVDIGHVIGIDKQSMTVLHETKQEYIIPTYFIREYNQEYVVIDISILYLYHYKPEQELQSSQIQRESIQSRRQQQRSQLELPTRATSNNNTSITTSSHPPRTLAQFKQSSDLLRLINRRVVTYSKGDIGYVYMIDKEFTTVLQGIKQQYVIPTRCIKEYDEENVFMEISGKSLNSCKVKAKL